jgi:hypothetical protein
MSKEQHSVKSMGITFVRKANMWQFYKNYNAENTRDEQVFFATEAEAKARLEQEQNAD